MMTKERERANLSSPLALRWDLSGQPLLHLGPCGSNLLEASSFRFTYQNALRFFLTALFRFENICFVFRESQIIRQGGAEGYGSLNPRLGNSE